MTLNAKIESFMDFFGAFGLDKSISLTRRRHGTGVGGVA